MWQGNPSVSGFRRDLRAVREDRFAAWSELYWRDRAAFAEQLGAAWDSLEPGPVIAAGQVLHRKGELNAKQAQRLWRRLLRDERPREALEVLLDHAGLHPENPSFWRDLALAEAAAGLLYEARKAADEALKLAPSEAGERLKDELLELRGLQGWLGKRKMRDWDKLARLAELQLEYGLRDEALRTLQIAARTVTLADDQIDPMGLLANELLSTMAPGHVADFMHALRAMQPHPSDRREIDRFLRFVRDGGGESGEIIDEGGGPRASGAILRVVAMAYRAVGALEAAIPRFGRLAEHPRDGLARSQLARSVSRLVLDQVGMRYEARAGGKVFDVFPFHNELDMLDMRLHEMAPWVDHFVIVEAATSFTGRPKPLTFAENRDRYAAFADKILHVVVDRMPPFVRHAWAREFYQRDMGLSAISGRCAPDDLVLITDVDEIVARSAIEGFGFEFAALKMEQSRYFLNYRKVTEDGQQLGLTSVWKARYLETVGLSYARGVLQQLPERPKIQDSGWHFSSMFAPADVGEKMKDVSHQEYAHLEGGFFADLFAQIRAGEPEPGWTRVALDESFPAYVLEHRAELASILL